MQNLLLRYGHAVGLFASLLLFLGVAFYMVRTGKEVYLVKEGAGEKIIQVKGMRLSGWNEKAEVWKIQAQGGWQTHDVEQFTLEKVHDGKIFEQGKVLVQQLAAPTLLIRGDRGDFELYSIFFSKPREKKHLITAQVLAKLNSASVSAYQLQAEHLRFDGTGQRFVLSETFLKKGATDRVSCRRVEVDLRKGIADFWENPVYIRNDMTLKGGKFSADLRQGTLVAPVSPRLWLQRKPKPVHVTAEKMFTLLAPERMMARGSVIVTQGDRKALAQEMTLNPAQNELLLQGNVEMQFPPGERDGEETNVYGARFLLDMEREDFATQDPIRLVQQDKWGKADQGRYEKKTGALTLTGNVLVELTKAESLLRQARLREIKNQEVLRGLRAKTTITADRMVVYPKRRDSEAYGKVQVTQKGQSARADAAFYNYKTEKITLSENVEVRKEHGEWVKAKRVIVDVKAQTFRAEGVQESQFLLKKS